MTTLVNIFCKEEKWGAFNINGNLVSADAVYTFIAENDFNLLAKFSGSNIPNSEWLTEHGMDGTFEDGTMEGWKAEDRDWGDDTSWALFDRSNEQAYNGEYSLKMRSRYRTTFYNFTDLKKNTKYHLSLKNSIIHCFFKDLQYILFFFLQSDKIAGGIFTVDKFKHFSGKIK